MFAIAQCVHNTEMLAHFTGADPQAMGTYEEEQATMDNTKSKGRDAD